MEKKTINIIGAGFSGLSLAYYLKKDFNVIVYEKDRVGGLLNTASINGGKIDLGATTIVLTKRIKKLFDKNGIKYVKTKKTSKNKYIFRNKPTKFPLGIIEITVLIFKFIYSFVFKKLKPKDYESIQEWGARALSKSAVDWLISPVFQGIYAGDITKLSANILLGKKFRKKEKKLGIVAPLEGMEDIVYKLKISCENSGVIFKNETAVIDSENIWVVATSANDSANILNEKYPEISNLLKKIEMIGLITANITLKGNSVKEIKGFGMLVPSLFNFVTLGILSPTYIFENRGSIYSESFIIGGLKHVDIFTKADSEIKEIIEKERAELLSDNSKIDKINIKRYKNALPHYTVEFEKILEELMPLLKKENKLFLTGNYLGGIGLTNIASYNKKLAKIIRRIVN